MEFDLKISNYRCFSREKPVTIRMGPGLTSFIGINNSGKSALLRFFFEFRPLFQLLPTNWGGLGGKGSQVGIGFNFPDTVKDREELFHNANGGPITIDIQPVLEPDYGDSIPCERMSIIVPRALDQTVCTAHWKGIKEFPGVNTLSPNYLLKGSGMTFDAHEVFEACYLLSRTVYLPAFRNAVNAGGGGKLFDMEVGQHFVTRWGTLRNSSSSKKNNLATAKLTEDIRQLLGFQSLDINPAHESGTLQLFVDGKPLRLDELGSGIAQFIMVLASASTMDPAIILIDEPELNLHPALQIAFLTTLASYASFGTLFATHSLGLARASSSRIYSVTRETDKSLVSPYAATTRLSELLGSMSYSGYSQLGFQKVLLVEGSTDVVVFQQFLRQYGLDRQVVILPLGGSDLIKTDCAVQLGEIHRICDNITAIVDSDRTSGDGPCKPEAVEFARICAEIGIRCHLTERSATENYLTARALKVAFGPKAEALGEYQKLATLANAWPKSQSWRAAREMTREEIDQTNLGDILKSL